MTGRLSRVTAALAAAVAVAAGLTACRSREPVVTILGSWVGSEEVAFRQVLDAAGIPYRYEGSRAPGALLQAALQKGAPPDIVLLPTIGDLADYIEKGQARPLDTLPGDPLRGLADDFTEPWLQTVSTPTGQHYFWVPIKADLKSIVWYDPDRAPLSGPSDAWTWPRLRQLRWCFGVGDTPNSGWPASDWVEDILLHQSGDGPYRDFAAANQPGAAATTAGWTSAAVRQAWQTFGQVLSRTPDHGALALLTDSADAALGMYATSPRCQVEHQASFGLAPPDGVSPDRRDFAPMPVVPPAGPGLPPLTQQKDHRAWEVSVDVASLFTGAPAARRMMAYLASPRAQGIWPADAAHPAFSVDQQVPTSIYGTGPRGRIATVLHGGGQTLCLDAGDLMPASLRDAFYRGLLEYMSAAAGGSASGQRLDQILRGLEQLRTQLTQSTRQPWNLRPCGP
jgi:alpha-glucoside transport system substrate-binding protein